MALRSWFLLLLATTLVPGCSTSPVEVRAPVLITAWGSDVPLVVVTQEGRAQSMELRIEQLESFDPLAEPFTSEPIALSQGSIPEGTWKDLPPGRYRAQVTSMVSVPEQGSRRVVSNEQFFTVPRRFELIRREDVMPRGEVLPLRVRLLFHPGMDLQEEETELVAAISRAAVQAVFLQVHPLSVSSDRQQPWKDLEDHRRRTVEATGQEPLPEMDPQSLLVIDYRPASSGVPEQILARLYDLSCREYDVFSDTAALDLTMHRALIFEEYVEVEATHEGDSRVVRILDAWRRLVGALSSSSRFRQYVSALTDGDNRLVRLGQGSHLLGEVRKAANEKKVAEHHRRIAEDILFSSHQERVPVEPREEPSAPGPGGS